MQENPFEERFLVIAEKPSVAMTIAAVLGCREKKDGYVESPDGAVSWCYGHLAEYAFPEAYDERYRKWSLDTLPIIPEKWKLVVPKDKAKQFRILKNLLNNTGVDRPFTYVVNACDPGREGQAIMHRVYALSGSRLPIKRMWFSSMEDDAILDAFLNMKSEDEYRHLTESAECRAQADWLVGMNASRAFTKVYNHRMSIGRVQTPTLAMIAERDGQIAGFQKQQFFVTHLLFECPDDSRNAQNAHGYYGTDHGSANQKRVDSESPDSIGTNRCSQKHNVPDQSIDAASEHFSSREEAQRLADLCDGQTAVVKSIRRRENKTAPPLLYDLTTLQRDANRLFGYSASKTLACAQSLYENKLITYPRTDSRYLTDDMEKTARDVLSACYKVFPFLASLTDAPRPDIRRILDSKKVSDHHAIIPTVLLRNADLSKCTEDERIVLTLIAARLACAVGRPHIYESVKAEILCAGHVFVARGKTIKEPGWKAIEAAMPRFCSKENSAKKHDAKDNSADDDSVDGEEKEDAAGIGVTNRGLSSFQEGVQIPFVQTRVTDHWTQPPKPFTEDTLLHAMENAGTEEMESDVERKGLGTPATRAGIIDKLVTSNYVTCKKKHLAVTPEGRQLVSILPDYLKSASMTAEWENRLLQVERGQYASRVFLDGIVQMISRMLQECRQVQSHGNSRPLEDKEGRKERAGHEDSGNSRPFEDKENRKERAGHEDFGKCPVCGAPVYESEKSFYCSDRNCRFILWKQSNYFDKWRVKLDSRMVRDLLTDGRTTVTNLYSQKKNKHFTADLVMEWQDGRAVFSLEFPKDSKGGQGS